jgi:hypothetical protein
MNSRARAIPNRNSWLKATTSKAALREPSGPAIHLGRLHPPPAQGITGLRSQEGFDAYRGRRGTVKSVLAWLFSRAETARGEEISQEIVTRDR